MSRHKVNIVGVNTSNIKVLSNEEMQKLFLELKNGDEKAREKIASGNLKLVLSILKKFTLLDENKDDLFQIGCIGLMKAIDNFNPEYGVKFSTYCVPMILGEVRRYIRDNTSLRVSRSLKDLAYKCSKAREELSLKLNKNPSNKEIAEYIGVNENDVELAINSKKEPISVYEPIYSDGGDTIYLYDQIEDNKNRIDNDTRISLKDAINSLDEREKYILEERFIIGKTQVELSEELDISQAQISRIEKKAIDTLRKRIE